MTGHPIVHIEIPAASASAVGKFYHDVFGWKVEEAPGYDYVMFQSEGGPGGGFVELGSEAPVEYKPDRLLVFLATDDIDATLATIKEHGGETVLGKTEIPHVGWWAVFTDPSGNHLALFTPTQHS